MKGKQNREASLRKLVELYGIYKAYELVYQQSRLSVIGRLFDVKRDEYRHELERHARLYYPNDVKRTALAKTQDDVLYLRGQLTILD